MLLDMTIPCLTRIFAQHSRTIIPWSRLGLVFPWQEILINTEDICFLGTQTSTICFIHPSQTAKVLPSCAQTESEPPKHQPNHIHCMSTGCNQFHESPWEKISDSQGKTKRPVLPVCPGPSPRQTNLNIIVIGDNHQNIPPKERKTITMRCSMMRFSRWRPWIKHPPLSGTSHQTWKKSAILLGKSTILKQTHIWYCWLHVPVSC